MKISYVGNRKNLASDGKSFNTENHIALTLEKLGHEVNFIQEDDIPFTKLPSMVAGSDIFLWTRTWPDRVTATDLKLIEAQGIPTVSFHLDLYSNIARDGGMSVRSPFWLTQYVFSPEGSPEAKAIFDLHGINQFYLPAGVYEDECYIADPVDEYKHDIIFVGGGVNYAHLEWPYRGKLINWLTETYPDKFVKYGHPERSIRGEELNKLYSSAKIVIGDSLCKNFTDTYYWSDRLFETTGRGGFMIHPYIKGLENHFNLHDVRQEIELVYYTFNDFDQLRRKIDYYLLDDNLRERIRRAGHLRTKRTNTYTNRMEQMLNILEREGAI